MDNEIFNEKEATLITNIKSVLSTRKSNGIWLAEEEQKLADAIGALNRAKYNHEQTIAKYKDYIRELDKQLLTNRELLRTLLEPPPLISIPASTTPSEVNELDALESRSERYECHESKST